jgi:glucose/galactose transporter
LMTAVCRTDWKGPLRWLIGCIALILFGGLAATAQQSDQLSNQMEEQLQQLKQQYQEATHNLEQSIAALEQQIEKRKEDDAKTKQRMVSAVELGAEDAVQEAILGASSQVGAKYQGQLPSEPTYDLLREADAKIAKLNKQLSTFESHGYFRSANGLNSVGGQQVTFQAPGAASAPKLGGLLILSAAPLAVEQIQQLTPQALHLYGVEEAASVKMPYTVIGIALVLLAVLIGTFRLPKIQTAAYRPGEKVNDSIWGHPNLLFGAIGIFIYVGAEVSIGSFLVNYFGLPEIAGLSAKTAAGFVSFYWGGAMIGRFLGAGFLRRFKPGYLLAVCAIFAAGLVTASMLLAGHTAMSTILAVGFFNSIMFPTIFSLGVVELGPLTGNASGLLNMAIVGGAILPVIQGSIADHVGIHHAFFLPVICYLYILFYGLSGSKPNSARSVTA